jgi:hypothetical protein
MDKTTNQALSAAVLKLLRPLVRVLLRHGMPYGSFAELARKAFVEEGFDHVKGGGKRPTVSGVSALTGLTRKETKRLRELDVVDDESSSQRYSRAIRVVSGWINDPRFQTGAGAPAVLPMEGEEGSFSELVKEYSGDIPPAAMLSVLQDSGTVVVDGQGVTLHARAYVPSATPAEKLEILGTDVAELIDTIGHNLEADPAERYFQRKVSNVLVHPDAVPAFREFSTRKSQMLLEEYHAWLSNNEIDPEQDNGTEPRYVAVGIYYSLYPGPGEDSP